MTLYLDTSALVKLYVEEQGSDRVAVWLEDATIVVTARVAYPEARAAFARRKREGALTAPALKRVVAALDRDFAAYVVVELLPEVAAAAGGLAERHALRGSDAIHLASAKAVQRLTGRAPVFGCFDAHLTLAAQAEALATMP